MKEKPSLLRAIAERLELELPCRAGADHAVSEYHGCDNGMQRRRGPIAEVSAEGYGWV